MKKPEISKEFYNIQKGRNLILDKGIIRVLCSKGIIWVTWPWSGDVLLRKGESIHIKSAGKICFNAFEDSNLDIEIADFSNQRRVFRNKGLLMKYTRLIMEK